jgi:hypothetical protein
MLVLAARGLSNRQIALEAAGISCAKGSTSARGDRAAVVMNKSVRKVVETVCQAPAKGLSRWSARTLGRHLNICFGNRQPHSSGEQIRASSVADLYL